MDVPFVGRDIEITAKQNWRRGIVVLVKELTQTPHPFQLELIFLGANHLPVGNVHVYNLNATNFSRKQPRMLRLVIAGITAAHLSEAQPRDNCDAVISLLSK